MLNRPAIILSDLHLGPTCPSETAPAVAEVIRRHPDHDVLLLGDTFDLSVDPPTVDPAHSVVAHLAMYPALRHALYERLQRDTAVVLFAGNHDAQLAQPSVRAQLLSSLELTDDAPLQCGLWCMQRAGLHLEHGNLYDPDNTHNHPLVAPDMTREPLGVAMMRNVLAPTNALFFSHAHEITPWAGLAEGFRRLGFNAPRLVVRYYIEAMRILARAQPELFVDEWQLGSRQLEPFARAHDLDTDDLSRILDLRASPRHQRRARVFYRLYLDRSLATVLFGSCAALGALTWQPAYFGAAGTGLLYLAWSISRGKNRYAGDLLRQLRHAALDIQRTIRCRAVVFGHTHVAEACPGYVNTGSFGYTGKRGASYLLLDSAQQLSRMWVSEHHAPERLDHVLDASAADARAA